VEEKIMGLQQFKMKVASSIVNQENASLRNMDTDQLLDLFNLSPAVADTPSKSSTSEPPMDSTLPKGVRSVLDSLGELWDDSQYNEEYNISSFLSSLSK